MPVKSYMAHHQGMILLAIQNYLQNDITVSRFTGDPAVRTVDILLREQPPENPKIVYARPRSTASKGLERPRRRLRGGSFTLRPGSRVHHLPMEISA